MIRKFLIFHSDEDFRLDNFKFKGEGGGGEGKRSIQGESTKIEIHVFFFYKTPLSRYSLLSLYSSIE